MDYDIVSSGGQSVPAFDFYLAPGVQKTFRKEFVRAIYNALTFGKYAKITKQEVSAIFVDCDITLEMSDEEMAKAVEALGKYISGEWNALSQIIIIAHDLAIEETDKKTYQAMEGFVHNLNTMHSRAGAQVPFSSINFGTDTTPEGRMVSKNLMLAQEAGLGNGETPIFPILIFKVKEGVNYNKEDINYDLFQLACRVSAKRLFPNFAFLDAPFNLQYYQEGRPESEATYMG